MSPLHLSFRRIRYLAPTCAGMLLAAALSGCGGSSNSNSATSPSPGAPSGPHFLVDHLPPITQLRDLHPIEFPDVINSPGEWTTSGGLPGTPGRADASRLARLGFVAGVEELLGSEQTTSAEVEVKIEEFRSSTAARTELLYRFAQARSTGRSPGYTFSRFGVQGVPGAFAYSINQPGTSSDAVTFASGPYFYSLQSVLPTGSGRAVPPQQVRADAATWYHHIKKL